MQKKYIITGFLSTLIIILLGGGLISFAVRLKVKTMSYRDEYPQVSLFSEVFAQEEDTEEQENITSDSKEEELLQNALQKYKTGLSHSFTSSTTIPVSVVVPRFSQLNATTTVSTQMYGECDQGVYMVTQTIEIDGTESVTETTRIGNVVYYKPSQKANYKLHTGKNAKRYPTYGEEIETILHRLDGNLSVSVHKGKKMNGEQTNVYTLKLRDKEVTAYAKRLISSLQSSIGGASPKKLTVGDAELKIWVGYDSKNILRGSISISSLSFETSEQGIDIEVRMKKHTYTTWYSNWGEDVSILAPI